MTTATEHLSGLWHLAGPARALKGGALVRLPLLGEAIVLGRTKSGEAFALRDVCPHRAAPLSGGRVVEGTEGEALVECPYHGWRFRAADGRCALIPALSEHDAFAGTDRISVKSYSVHEANGLVWIYHGEGAPCVPPPDIGLPDHFRPRTLTQVKARGPYDEAVIGLIDPAHTPFVHRQWWWREGKPAMEKEKHFEPTPLGFKMPAHRPSSNSRIYGFLGGAPTTEIEFRLPGLRLETIRNDRHVILGLTAITPTAPGETLITHVIYWDSPALTALTPVISGMARNFLSQDGAILIAQGENLEGADHRPLYAGEPDAPAQWYFRLKRAWAACEPHTEFENPLSAQTLRWRT